MKRLDGKVAIITGGAQGMGAEHARLFVQEGAQVVVTDINEVVGNQLISSLPQGQAIFIKQDVCLKSDWEQVIASTIKTFGKIDILVNNAGITMAQSIFDITEEAYQRIVNINQLSVFLGIQAVAPFMRDQKSGSIINVSSINGLVGGAIGYTDTKFAIRGLTKAAALDLAPYNVRVNSVHPGVIETPMLWQEDTREQVEQFINFIPMRRIAQPNEISKLVLFLASDESSYSTGSEFIADGGITAQ